MAIAENSDFEIFTQKLIEISKESPTYEKLAYYIEKNYLRLIFMTAGELASELNISQGSVSRFFITLGFRGYNDFLRSLQKIVSAKITAPQRLEYTAAGTKIDSTISVEVGNMCELDRLMHEPAYHKMIDCLISDRDLFILSARMSATLVPYMRYILCKMRDSVYEVTPDSIAWDTINLREPSKTEIFTIAFPRYPKTLVDKIKNLHDSGFHISAITDSQLSPIIPYCDNVIDVPITVSSIFDIYSTPMAFINLMLRDAAKEIPSLEDRLNRIEKNEGDSGAYYKRGK
ncbi:MAG TPA: MurR/RpiR family transcriptional regulator [Clostridia bacterium]|nr:MurR/RpiR family transcriptional regulator [Clostridia bacterium]